jgi:oligopeptide transport system permease protein
MTLALLVGTALGAWAALNQNRWEDYSVMTLAMLGITIPTFVTAPILTLLLGIYAGWLPVGGWNSGALANMILPVTVLALPQIAIVARLLRGSMVEVLRANYIRTARAKGLPAHRIVLSHALRAAALPLVSYLGPALAAILTGSLVVEEIFGLPGIGRYFVQGALNRDYTLVLGVVICYAALVVALNFLADIAYALLDPRVRLS